MGKRGPVPKRSDQRRRRNQPEGGPVTVGASIPSKPPPTKGDWHPVARRWFNALKKSGQNHWYEASDWALAYLIAESISRELSPQPLVVGKGEDAQIEWHELPPKGASLAAWLSAMSSLLATEGDRRRAALELTKPAPDNDGQDAEVTSLEAWRGRADL